MFTDRINTLNKILVFNACLKGVFLNRSNAILIVTKLYNFTYLPKNANMSCCFDLAEI